MVRPLWTLTAAALVAAPTGATAQVLSPPQARQGYYLSAAAHAVGAHTTERDLGRLGLGLGGAAGARIGEMVTPWLGLGFAASGGSLDDGRWRQSYGGLLLDAQLVPWRHLALHLGAGVGFVRATDQEQKVDGTVGTAGAYYSAGLRYDVFPLYGHGSGGLALTPGVQIKHFPGESLRSTMVWLGIEGVYWFGLDKQELELSPDEAFTASR